MKVFNTNIRTIDLLEVLDVEILNAMPGLELNESTTDIEFMVDEYDYDRGDPGSYYQPSEPETWAIEKIFVIEIAGVDVPNAIQNKIADSICDFVIIEFQEEFDYFMRT